MAMKFTGEWRVLSWLYGLSSLSQPPESLQRVQKWNMKMLCSANWSRVSRSMVIVRSAVSGAVLFSDGGRRPRRTRPSLQSAAPFSFSMMVASRASRVCALASSSLKLVMRRRDISWCSLPVTANQAFSSMAWGQV